MPSGWTVKPPVPHNFEFEYGFGLEVQEKQESNFGRGAHTYWITVCMLANSA